MSAPRIRYSVPLPGPFSASGSVPNPAKAVGVGVELAGRMVTYGPQVIAESYRSGRDAGPVGRVVIMTTGTPMLALISWFIWPPLTFVFGAIFLIWLVATIALAIRGAK